MARRSDCPISFTLDQVGDKWSLLIIRDILFSEKSLYGEFLDSDEGVATNILAHRLQRLVRAGILRKTPARTAETRKGYVLTPKGLDLLPILLDIIAWGAKYDPKSGAPPAFVERILRDRDGVLAEIQKKFKNPEP